MPLQRNQAEPLHAFGLVSRYQYRIFRDLHHLYSICKELHSQYLVSKAGGNGFVVPTAFRQPQQQSVVFCKEREEGKA